MKAATGTRPRVGLFVTCLVDLIRPRIGFAAAKLLEDAGCIVEVPKQTCCGQPAYNSGDRATTRKIAEQVIDAFEPYDYVVAPSGSCAGMIKVHYPGCTIPSCSPATPIGCAASTRFARARSNS
jgi:L-lactate dehydrogenase complex protein LldE